LRKFHRVAKESDLNKTELLEYTNIGYQADTTPFKWNDCAFNDQVCLAKIPFKEYCFETPEGKNCSTFTNFPAESFEHCYVLNGLSSIALENNDTSYNVTRSFHY